MKDYIYCGKHDIYYNKKENGCPVCAINLLMSVVSMGNSSERSRMPRISKIPMKGKGEPLIKIKVK